MKSSPIAQVQQHGGAVSTGGNPAGRVPAFLLSSLFILIGVVAIAWFGLAVYHNPAIRQILDWTSLDGDEPPSLILAFLVQFGIVLPLLVLGLGLAMIGLGIQLRSRSITIARWATVALTWLTAGTAFIALYGLVTDIPDWLAADRPTPDLAPLLLPVALAIPLGLCLLWLHHNIERTFNGQEKLSSRETRLAWNLLIPTLAVFILVAARPLEQTFIRSLTDKRFAGQAVPAFVGLRNYQNLLGFRLDVVPCRVDDDSAECMRRPDGSLRWESIDRELLQQGYRTVWNVRLPTIGGEVRSVAISGVDADFIRAIGTTLIFTVASVSLELIIGLFIAMTVNSNFAGRGLMRAVMLIPWAIPTVISARLWELMLKDTSAGIVNRILMDLSIIDRPQAWLSDAALQLPMAIAVDVWKTSPFMALLLLAGLQTIPKELYEAADVDGASRTRQFFAITLPLLSPTIVVALVFRTLDALRVFDLFNVMFGRQQLTMATYNYEMLVNNQRDGYASAISIIIFVLISVFALGYVRMLSRETD